MSIMDIGILTGFSPDKKSLQKVNILLLYLQRILDLFLGTFYLISVPRGTSSSLGKLTSTQYNPKLKWLFPVGCFCECPPTPPRTHFQVEPHSQVFGVCLKAVDVSVGMVGKGVREICWEVKLECISTGKKE